MVKNILVTYETTSDQAISLPKSDFCSRNIAIDMKVIITNILGLQDVLVTSKYLGLPSMVERDKNATFAYIRSYLAKK